MPYSFSPLHEMPAIFRHFMKCRPEERPGMSYVPLLSGISGLSFDSPFLSPLFFLSLFFFFFSLPSPLALSVLSFFCLCIHFFCLSILLTFFQKTLKYFSLRVRLYCMALVEQLQDDSFLNFILCLSVPFLYFSLTWYQ